jgi:dTDP-4-amino-4,6-dideoxygalactose transaminase
MGVRFGYAGAGELPITKDVAGRLVRLPFYPDITEEEQERVAERVRAFFAAKKPAGNAKRNIATAIVSRELCK